jgi:hypothetical protein
MRIDVHAHYWTDDYLDLLIDLARPTRARRAASGAAAAPSWRRGCG